MTTAGNPSDDDLSSAEPIKSAAWDLKLEKNESQRCTAHKKNGERCRRFSILGTSVCRVHGGAAGHVKRKARLRLEMASDRLARQLLNMTSDPNVADPVKLAAIKDALDRSGLAAKTAVSVEVGVKPFERVFDSIMAGPRDPQTPPALAELPESDSAAIESTESDNGEILAEFDDDPLPEGDEIEPQPEQKSSVIDVEIVADEYTDTAMSGLPGPLTPDESDYPLSEPLSGPVHPGSGLMSLTEANEQAARIRGMRRR